MSFARPDAGGQTDSAAIPGGDAVAIPGADAPAVSPPTEGGREGEAGSGAGVEPAAADRVEESPAAPVVTEPPAGPVAGETPERAASADPVAPPEILPWPDTDPWPLKVPSPETIASAETVAPAETEASQTEAPAETPAAPEILPWPDTDPWPPTIQKPETVASAETVAPADAAPLAEILPWPATDPWPPPVAAPDTVPPAEIVPWPQTMPSPESPPSAPPSSSPETEPPPEIVPWPATVPWPQTVPLAATVASPETDRSPETGPPPEPSPPPRGLPLRPGPCLARLDDGIAAATALGLAVDEAEATRTEADKRLGLSSDVCVVALVGGTGVGKSTLLNALAGTEVSAASARRPTTGQPVAWIPGAARDEMKPLLDWLGVDAIVDHADPRLASVAILDLPDLDSVDRSHRQRVEELLPRVDAVIWVSDPEKYRDAVLHEDFLVRWLPRLDRQLVVLNKSDRLGAGDLEPVRAHFERSLRSDMVEGPGSPAVVAAAAKRGEIEPVRDWVNAQVDAKRVVLGRISASVVDGLEQLARQAGVNPDVQAQPILDPGDRKRSIDAATDQVLRLVDLPAATRQAVAATRAAARPRGLGPLGKLTGWLYRTSGRQSRVADPELFLRSWTDRGSLAPALDALRSAVDEPLRTAPPAIRPAIAASVDGNRQAMRLRGAVDAAITAPGPLVAPTSRLWPVLGVLQTLATGAVAVAAVWLVLLVLLRPPVDLVTLPLVGRVPAPFAMLIGALIAAFLVARVLAVHAGWLGRRWANSVAADVRAAVERAVADEAFAPLDRVDTARRSLWLAARGARDACARR